MTGIVTGARQLSLMRRFRLPHRHDTWIDYHETSKRPAMTTGQPFAGVRIVGQNSPVAVYLFNQEYMTPADGYAARSRTSAREAEPVGRQVQLTHGLAKDLHGYSAAAEGSTRATAGMGQYSAPPRNNAPTGRVSDSVAILSAPESITPDLRLSGIETREQKYTQPQDTWHLGSGFGRMICQLGRLYRVHNEHRR